MSDKDYETFVEWLVTKDFSYTTALEKNTEQLIEIARNERMYADLEIYLDGLRNKIEANKASDYVRFKDEIKALLEEEIAFHYDLENGRAQVSLPRDEDIIAAKKVLKDSAAYEKIFHPVYAAHPQP